MKTLLRRWSSPSRLSPGRPAFAVGSALTLVAVGAVATTFGAPVAATDDVLVSVEPARLIDTRSTAGASTLDGQQEGGGEVAAGSTTRIAVSGRGGVPADAAGVFVNVAAVDPQTTGYFTVFDCEGDRPLASSVNYRPGTNTSSGALTAVGSTGDICIYSHGRTQLLVDVSAYVPSSGSPVVLDAARLVDTRTTALSTATVDGNYAGNGPAAPFEVTEVTVAGRGGVASDAESAVLTVTAVRPPSRGYVALYPCGETTPLVSTVNFAAGETTPNLAIVGVGDGGSVCFVSSVEVDVVVDTSGFVPAGGQPSAMTPARLTDTRLGTTTVDGLERGEGRLVAGETRTLGVAGRAGVPGDATIALLNVTAVEPAARGHVRVYPCGGDLPDASNANFGAGGAVANSVVAAVGDNGSVCIYSSAEIDLVVDVTGFVAVATVTETDTGTDADTDSGSDTDSGTDTGADPQSECEAVAAAFVTKGSANSNLADPEVAAICDGDSVVVESNGIPDYTYIQTSPGDPRAQDYSFEIPATPTVADGVSDIARLGPVAVATNGVPIYGPTEGTGGDVNSLVGGLSECGSHNGPTGFHLHLFGTSETTDCMFTPEQAAAAPQLFGYAFDGYPIYTGNDQYTSSWQLTDATLFATDTWSAHSYVAGSGDLDECNGLTDANGNYAYYTTDTFPYVLGCYRGEAATAGDTGGGGGPGGQGGPGGNGGPGGAGG